MVKWMSPEEQKAARKKAQEENNKRTTGSYRLPVAPAKPVPLSSRPRLKKDGEYADVLVFDTTKRKTNKGEK